MSNSASITLGRLVHAEDTVKLDDLRLQGSHQLAKLLMELGAVSVQPIDELSGVLEKAGVRGRSPASQWLALAQQKIAVLVHHCLIARMHQGRRIQFFNSGCSRDDIAPA
jgi:hypothetical protein